MTATYAPLKRQAAAHGSSQNRPLVSVVFAEQSGESGALLSEWLSDPRKDERPCYLGAERSKQLMRGRTPEIRDTAALPSSHWKFHSTRWELGVNWAIPSQPGQLTALCSLMFHLGSRKWSKAALFTPPHSRLGEDVRATVWRTEGDRIQSRVEMTEAEGLYVARRL